jgi:hypothetical protein
MQNIDLIKEVKGIATYNKVIDTSFSELITVRPVVTSSAISTREFFNYYENLFFDIPISGSTDSHQYLIKRSTEYLGAPTIDEEKQALIDEINSLRQQLVDLSQNYLTISSIS